MSSNYILERLEIEENSIISQNKINFKKGLNLIFGNNETGKTTLLTIINFLNKSKDYSKNEYLLKLNKDLVVFNFKFFLNVKSLGFSENGTIVLDVKGNNINLLSASEEIKKNNEVNNILDKIKILYINNQNVEYILGKEEIPENINRDQQYYNIFLKVTENLENYIILIDNFYLFNFEANNLFFHYIAQLSEKNQVIFTLLPHIFKDLIDHQKETDSNLLHYLRQSQILFLRGVWQKTLFDYFKEISISDSYVEFQIGINNVKDIIDLPVKDKKIHLILYRFIYANIITIMETYLSDCFTKIVIKDKYLKLKLIDSIPEFSQKKTTLRDAYDWLENMDDNIIETLQTISFHNLGKVKNMFKNIIGVNFPNDVDEIFKAIIIRHDIIHRNGKNKKGEEIEITREILQELLKSVVIFIENIENQISEFYKFLI